MTDTTPAAVPLPLTDDQLRQVAAKYLHDAARENAGDVMGHLEALEDAVAELEIEVDVSDFDNDASDAIAERISDLMATADITVEWRDTANPEPWRRFDYDRKAETKPPNDGMVWIIEEFYGDGTPGLGYFDGFTFRLAGGSDDCSVLWWMPIVVPAAPANALGTDEDGDDA